MKKDDDNRFTSLLKSKRCLDVNGIKFDSFTAFLALKILIDNGLVEVQTLANDQDLLKKNSTASRVFAHDADCEFVLELGNKLTAFATVTNNKSLLDKVRVNSSMVYRCSDNQLVTLTETLINCAEEYMEDLPEYGVTEQTLVLGNGFLKNFQNEMQNYLQSKGELKQLTVQIHLLLRTIGAHFNVIDAMVETMRFSDPVFYRLYWNARSKRKATYTTLSVKGKVFDSATNLPLRGAWLSVVMLSGNKATAGSDLAKNVKIKSAGGGFNLKGLPTGAYLFTVTFAGYADQQITVYVNEGNLTPVEIALSKLEPPANR